MAGERTLRIRAQKSENCRRKVHFDAVENVSIIMGKPKRTKDPEQTRSGKRARPETMTVTLNALGVHRRKREALRAIGEKVEKLQNLVGLLQSIAGDTFADDPPEQLRASSTILRTTLREIAGTAVEMASDLGELRFAAHVSALEIEPPDNSLTSLGASSPAFGVSSLGAASGPSATPRIRRPR